MCRLLWKAHSSAFDSVLITRCHLLSSPYLMALKIIPIWPISWSQIRHHNWMKESMRPSHEYTFVLPSFHCVFINISDFNQLEHWFEPSNFMGSLMKYKQEMGRHPATLQLCPHRTRPLHQNHPPPMAMPVFCLQQPQIPCFPLPAHPIQTPICLHQQLPPLTLHQNCSPSMMMPAFYLQLQITFIFLPASGCPHFVLTPSIRIVHL